MSLPLGHDSGSVYSEDIRQSSTDPHERYHPIHKEYYERGSALNPSTEDSHQFSSRRSRHSTSGSQWQANIGADNEQVPAEAATTKNEEVDQPVAVPPRAPLPGLNGLISDGQLYLKSFVIPETIEKIWVEFMNKNEDDKEYAIEILIGPPDHWKGSFTLRSEKVEKLTRKSGHEGLTPLVNSNDPFTSMDCSGELLHTRLNEDSTGPAIPYRIRINSPIVLIILSRIDGSIDPTEPIVMFRPYKLLVFYEKEIRDAAEENGRHQKLPASMTQPTAQGDVISHMACLLGFMDKYICSTLRRLADGSATKIAFPDLWYIFQPGVDLAVPLRVTQGALTTEKKNLTPQAFRDRYQILWRVSSCGGGRPRLSDAQDNYDDFGIKSTAFGVNAFYIDFDGRYFIPTHHSYFIQPFEGEKDIVSLDFYPARFKDDGEQLIREHANYGEQIFRTVTEGDMHFYYSGYTMVTHPCGCAISEGMHQEAVDSEVIIDTKAALLQNPSWQPQANIWKAPPIHSDELKERHAVNLWSDSGRKKLLRSTQDYIYDDNEIDLRKAVIYRDKTQIFKPIPSAWLSNARMVPEEDFHIFPGRVFAFVLRTRSFAPLWIWDLKPMRQQRESLSNLQLRDNSSKDILTTLVESHYEQALNNPEFEYDLIRGKCKGLIILLHGVAGTGKTSTAESITAALGKPLFQITCGDLGTKPNEVEKALKQIFRYAQTWGCVLLLDECEIFLSRRTRNDINHNALVSVFLRTLELYTGVLFLTTNRVGVLDNAIKSRLTWTSYYPPLDLEQTKKIWKTHIRMLKERRPDISIDEESILKFASRHFHRCHDKDCTWNGREIQNAFKVAISLAEKDRAKDNDTSQDKFRSSEPVRSPRHRPKLRAKHFKTVAKNMNNFHAYFQEATGFTENERAYHAMERADDWNTEDTDSDAPRQRNGRSERYRTSEAEMVSRRDDSPSPKHKSTRAPTQSKYDALGSNSGGRKTSKSSQTARRDSGATSRVTQPKRSSNSLIPVTRDDSTYTSEHVSGNTDGPSDSESESS